MSSSHVLHAASKQIILSGLLGENGAKCTKLKKASAKLLVFIVNTQIRD